ncbi:MAG: single-stranded DNA-binding protein [Solobacterium sp.]|nr:single-stranded DNA-binding protein [Solobacterium sp.]
MSGINTVVLVGRLTKDVEVRKTNSGVSYARFTVACDRRYSGGQNAQGNSQQPTADFIGCVAWRQSADFLGSYGRKGTLIGVNGSIQTGSYTDRDGKKVYTTDVLCDRVQILESRNASQSQTSSNSYSAPEPQDPFPASDGFGSDDGFNTGPSFDIASDDLPF